MSQKKGKKSSIFFFKPSFFQCIGVKFQVKTGVKIQSNYIPVNHDTKPHLELNEINKKFLRMLHGSRGAVFSKSAPLASFCIITGR
jgi:hypothetical protein